MKAYFNNPPPQSEQVLTDSERVQSQFDSMHSPLQKVLDQQAIASFESGRLVCKNQSTGDFYKPDKIFVPSLTYLVRLNDKTDQVNYEIKGGWVNKNKAKHLVAESARNDQKRAEIAKHTAPIALRHLFGRIPKPAFEAA